MRPRTNNGRSICRGHCASTDFGLTLFMGRRAASRRRSEPEKMKILRSKGVATLFLAAVAAFVIASEASAEKGLDEVHVQGGWAYAARGNDDVVAHMAATRAAEDAAWLLLACSADGRLTVSLIEGKSVQNNQLFVDPIPMRHVMPLLMQDDELVVSVPDRDGAMHNYTFSMQPNDLALRPIRSRCFDF